MPVETAASQHRSGEDRVSATTLTEKENIAFLNSLEPKQIRTIVYEFIRELKKALNERQLHDFAHSPDSKMYREYGTTLALSVTINDIAYVFSVGDSEVLSVLPDKKPERLNPLHSIDYPNEFIRVLAWKSNEQLIAQCDVLCPHITTNVTAMLKDQANQEALKWMKERAKDPTTGWGEFTNTAEAGLRLGPLNMTRSWGDLPSKNIRGYTSDVFCGEHQLKKTEQLILVSDGVTAYGALARDTNLYNTEPIQIINRAVEFQLPYFKEQYPNVFTEQNCLDDMSVVKVVQNLNEVTIAVVADGHGGARGAELIIEIVKNGTLLDQIIKKHKSGVLVPPTHKKQDLEVERGLVAVHSLGFQQDYYSHETIQYYFNGKMLTEPSSNSSGGYTATGKKILQINQDK